VAFPEIADQSGRGSFKTQFKRADKSGAELRSCSGREVERGVAAVKDLRRDVARKNAPLSESMNAWAHCWVSRLG